MFLYRLRLFLYCVSFCYCQPTDWSRKLCVLYQSRDGWDDRLQNDIL